MEHKLDNYMKMRRSTIERCIYPDCKESIVKTSNTIFLAPCYAADGTSASLACFDRVYQGPDTVQEDDFASMDENGQRNTVSRQ